ncbi:hypothetical protein MalM25_03610 [Planctomycetes bacterium MalM25]|nr:hypothetical protein MalM25_03610 [Planctomycetes bacterium MalM25]
MINDEETDDLGVDESKRTRPFRKSSGPGRERKQKARRASRRKSGGASPGGIHRRGQKQRPS